MNLYPAILTESAEVLQTQLNIAKQIPDLEAVQIDLIDGQFVDAQTVSLQTVVEADHEGLALDLHLMVDEPMDWVWEMIEWKDQLPIRTVIGQIERMTHPSEFIAEVKNQGWRVGLALDIYTPWEEIDPDWLHDVDVIQLLGGPAGKQGQSLNQTIFAKLQEAQTEIHRVAQGTAGMAAATQPIELMVDIGVTLETVKPLVKAGATGLVSGSALWKSTDPMQAYERLLAAMTAAER
jgi:ribulose-phosphate 3-epimerase